MDALRALTARPRLLLATLLLLDAVALAFGAARAWDADPFLTRLHGDALEYWEWAGRIAAGDFVEPTPFLSAPLYPWLLGLARALGAGLPAVFTLQILLRAGAAVLLYRAAARAGGGPPSGLAAAALLLALSEPAFHATRVVAVSLQLFLIAWLLDRWSSLGARRGAGALVGLGALIGANLLANPPMLLVLGALPLAFGWRCAAAWRASGLVAAGCALAVAPATLHNALATRGSPGGTEFILVSAQSGVTYAHGNGPGAIGVYRALPGVAQDRRRQNLEAYALAARATGSPGWGATSSFFRRQATDWLLAHPDEAALLYLRKAGFLLFDHDYGDLYQPTLENDDPDWPRPVPLPFGALPIPWLLPAAAVGAAWLACRRGREAVPALALLLIPCAVVLIFWYSPRYRMPLAAPACLLAVLGLRAAWAAPPRARLAWLAVIALIPVAGGAVLRSSGLAGVERYRPEYAYHAGYLLHEDGRHAEAALRFEQALALGYAPAPAAEMLGRARAAAAGLLYAEGDAAAAEAALRAAAEAFDLALGHEPERLDALVDAAQAHALLAERHGDPSGTGRARELLRAALRITARAGDETRSAILRRRLAALPPE